MLTEASLKHLRSLLQPLSEAYLTTLHAYGGKPFDVFKNPSLSEIKKEIMTSSGTVRAVLLGSDAILWNGGIATHSDVLTQLANPHQDSLSLMIFIEPSRIDIFEAATSRYTDQQVLDRLKANPYIQKLAQRNQVRFGSGSDQWTSLNEELSESYLTTLHSRNDSPFDVYKNPSYREVFKTINTNGFVRALIKGTDVLCWEPGIAIHRDVGNQITGTRQSLPLYIYYRPGQLTIVVPSDLAPEHLNQEQVVDALQAQPYFFSLKLAVRFKNEHHDGFVDLTYKPALQTEAKAPKISNQEITSVLELLASQNKIELLGSTKEVVAKIQEILASCPDLRGARYQSDPNPLAGHCYVASEALHHLLKARGNNDWVANVAQIQGGPHWWLKNKTSGEILDPTASQFKEPVAYQTGKNIGFLTKQPSKRAMVVLAKLLGVPTPALRQEVTEAFHTALIGYGKLPFEVFKNPTRGEIRKLDPKYNGLRGFLTATEAFVWGPRYMNHAALHEALGLPPNALPVLLYFGPGAVSIRVTDWSRRTIHHHNPSAAALIKAHPWFPAIKTKIEDIDYYDSAIDGDWAEMTEVRQDVTEAFLTSLVNSEGGSTALVDVYKNPTKAEIKEMDTVGDLRAIMKGRNFFVWAAKGAIHYDVSSSIVAAQGGVLLRLWFTTPGMVKVTVLNYAGLFDDDKIRQLLKTSPWLLGLNLSIQVRFSASGPWEPLHEAFLDTISTPRTEALDLWKNPTKSELENELQSKIQPVRGFLTSNDAIFFLGERELHHNVMLQRPELANAIPVMITFKGRSADVTVTETARDTVWKRQYAARNALIMTHPYFKTRGLKVEITPTFEPF